MSKDERRAALATFESEYGAYTTERWAIKNRIEALERQDAAEGAGDARTAVEAEVMNHDCDSPDGTRD